MIRGIDYAEGDNTTPPDFHAAFSAGARFTLIRRSSTFWDRGHQAWRLYHDPCYTRDAQRARDAGLVVGSYLFPSFALHAPTPAAQVANFVAAEGEIRKGVDFPPCLDVEFPGNGISDTGRTQADCLFLVKAFVHALTEAYGCAPLIYTSHVEMHDSNGLGLPAAGSWPELTACPLWIKVPYRLKAGQPVDQTPPAAPQLPAPWKDAGWWLRQSQGDAVGFAGFDGKVDVDDFSSGANFAGMVSAKLTKAGYQPNADGTRRFQHDRGLVADGIVGPKTGAALLWV